MRHRPRLMAGQLAAALALTSLSIPGPLFAAPIEFVVMTRTEFLTQTGDGNSVSSSLFRLDAVLNETPPDQSFTSASLTLPDGTTTHGLSPLNATTWVFSAPFGTLAAMDSAFPTGTYTYSTTNPAASTTLAYAANAYPPAPFLTGTDFSTLQGLDPSDPFTFHFSAFPTDPALTEQLIFFSVVDEATNATVANGAFLDETTSTFFLAPNTLLPNHAYVYELLYSNRIFGAANGDASFGPGLAFERRTSARFVTGDIVASVPEPGTLCLLLIGLAGIWRFGGRAARRS